MSISTSKTKVIRLDRKDPAFHIHDNVVVYPRAMVELSDDCPSYTRMIIEKAFRDGHMKTVAYIYEHEHMFNVLKDLA